MTPGPTEPTCEQMQNYLAIIVEDLLKLFETGISIPTPSYPLGYIQFFLYALFFNNLFI